MKKITNCFLLILLMLAATAFSQPERGTSTGINSSDWNNVLKWLPASYKAMHDKNLDSDGKVIFITMSRGYVVISYLNARRGKYGGNSHIVIDPKTDKVVLVYPEE